MMNLQEFKKDQVVVSGGNVLVIEKVKRDGTIIMHNIVMHNDVQVSAEKLQSMVEKGAASVYDDPELAMDIA